MLPVELSFQTLTWAWTWAILEGFCQICWEHERYIANVWGIDVGEGKEVSWLKLLHIAQKNTYLSLAK